ncbi:MAG: hypothetical protein EOP54_17615 [Sphingobacteriales bacterium]|nr:MAG: hypothetical protein EOP54_17615 [Sphingobacteriales bacterium]
MEHEAFIPHTFAAVRRQIILYLFLVYALGTNAQEHYCVDRIIFEGDFRTRPALLTRELNFKEKDCILLDSLSQYLKVAEKRLFNTQLFNKVQADTLVQADQNVVRFYLDERFPVFPKPNLEFADRNFNVWWQEQGAKLNRLNLGLGLIHQNVRGRREELGLEGQIGYTRKFALSYNIPFLDRQQKQGIGASVAVCRLLPRTIISSLASGVCPFMTVLRPGLTPVIWVTALQKQP